MAFALLRRLMGMGSNSGGGVGKLDPGLRGRLVNMPEPVPASCTSAPNCSSSLYLPACELGNKPELN